MTRRPTCTWCGHAAGHPHPCPDRIMLQDSTDPKLRRTAPCPCNRKE